MKKHLLLGISLAIGVTMSAQSNLRKLPGNAKIKKMTNFVKVPADDKLAVPAKSFSPTVKNTSKLTAPPYKKFSSSYNQLTTLVSQSNCLNYNLELNAVSFVHRQSPTFGNAGANSGNTQISWTVDNGANWDSLVFGYCNGSNVNYRYPSGAIWNPPANTNIDEAYVVASGPLSDGSTPWVGNYYVSGKLDGTNLDNTDAINGSNPLADHHFARIDFDIVGGKAKVSSEIVNDITGTTVADLGYRGAAIATGTYNPGTMGFDWSLDTFNIQNNAQVDAAGDAYMSTAGGYHAWSDDGSIGYVMFLGVDVAAATPGARSYQPIVFKTTNYGTTWSQYMPGFDWGSLQVFQDSLISYDGVNVKPFFTQQHGNDMAVDYHGDLHIAIQVLSGASDDQDSLAYVYNSTNYFFDCYTVGTGWNAEVIAIELADPSADEATVPWSDQSTSPADPYNVDARLQISKSNYANKLFFVWADNDVDALGLQFPILEQPELRARGVDVDSRCWTPTKQFYGSADYTYWHYTSQRAIQPTSSSYIIPTTYVNSADGTNNAIAKVNHYYVDDIMFDDNEFTICLPTGVSANEPLVSGVGVFPNPSGGNSSMTVKLREAKDLSVNVYNALGQIVIAKKLKAEAGINKIGLGTENLASGVYFYELKVEGLSFTDKLMIQK
jgi:hypothetical protein